jgi:hypothetical protein
MTSTAARRTKAAAAAQRRVAKERRQRFMVIGLVALLVVVLAFEVPKLMKAGSSSSSSSTAAPVVVTTTAVAPSGDQAAQSKALKAALKQSPRDVFIAQGTGSPTTLGSVATPPGLHDPFAAPRSSQAAVVPVTPTAPPKTPQLPGKIVLGTPGAGKVTVTGWIVILASIPTDAGESSATSFAKTAGKAGLGKISIINSSNRKPLRGGFWVVYTGPYASLPQVSSAADNVHKSGFTGAYIRELVVYKAKPAAKKTTAKKKK